MLRKSRAIIGMSTMAALILATGADFAARPIPTVFNPTIVQAMDAVAGHTTLALNAPTLLPHRSSGYLTAMTAALPDAYQVTVWDTRQPLHVNNAAIVSERMSGGNVARFGAVRLVHPMPPQGAPNYLTALEQHNPVWAGGPATLERGTVNLADGIHAVHYQAAAQAQLDWTEGDWTIEVAGRSLAMAEKAAVPVVHLLNAYYLPPYPGIYAVRLQDGGRTAITSIDWMRGRVLSYVTNDHASATNPVVTGGMAISWRLYVDSHLTASSPPESSMPASGYPPIIQQSLDYLHGRTRLPLGGPAKLPPHPFGVWSAIVSTKNNAWTIQGYLTTKPYPLNHAKKIESPAHLVDWEIAPEFTLGVQRLPHAPSSVFSTVYSAAGSVTAYSELTSQPATAVTLADGIHGTAYGSEALVWTKGTWTFIAWADSRWNQSLANKMIRGLAERTVPSVTGVVTMGVGVHGIWENLAWIKGKTIYSASTDGQNVGVGMNLALSWKGP